MSIEAQNAFLKLLEEPPEDTLIIITAVSRESLLPTINSRVQLIKINPPNKNQVLEFYKTKNNSDEILKAYYTCEGYMGLLAALLNNESKNPLIEQIGYAKQILSSSSFERLSNVDKIVKSSDIQLFLQALERVCHAALIQSISSNKSSSKNWTVRLNAVIEAKDQLNKNVQSKLILTSLMLNL